MEKGIAIEKAMVFNWINKIIQTCSTEFHFLAVDKIICLFYEKYLDGTLRTELNNLREKKWSEIYPNSKK